MQSVHLLSGLLLSLFEAYKFSLECLKLQFLLFEVDHLAFVLELKGIQVNQQACILFSFFLNVLLCSVFILCGSKSSLSYRLLCVSESACELFELFWIPLLGGTAVRRL